jgi:ferredoxin|tara:strand:+ start:180 stop:560 length:381 start_codon:yes stop_codon:yes gene_type:complete
MMIERDVFSASAEPIPECMNWSAGRLPSDVTATQRGIALMAEKKKGPPIWIHAERCTGCLICVLRCSLKFEKAFNPDAARIAVRRLVGADTEYAVSLEDDCDNCGICVRNCLYEALFQEEKVRRRA